MESVQCAECSDRYDSDENPFCPRCGAMERVDPAGPHAASIADRRDPRKRRVKAAGIFLTAMGIMTALLFGMTAAFAHDVVPDAIEAFADQPGGDVHILVADAGVPVANATVTVVALDGMYLRNGTTDAEGRIAFTDLEDAGLNVTVQHGGGEWSKHVLSLEQLHSGSDAPQVDFDLSAPATATPEWVGLGSFITMSRVILGFFALVSVVTVVGGIAAIRLHRRGVAMAGAGVGLLPWLILFAASLSLAVALVLALFVVALVVLRQGREHFV